MIRKFRSKSTIICLTVIILLMFFPANWVNAALPIIDPDTLRQDDLVLSDLDLLQATLTLGPWMDVPGSLSAGFIMQIDPAATYYYFDAANLIVNRPLADDLYPFYLDTASLPAGFYTYWEARGVTASASGGWEEIMWDIITGTAPMFYLKVDGTSYDLVDGLQYLASSETLEEPLRVNGDYPLGDYYFNGAVEDELGYTDDVVVAITFMPPFSLDALDLFGSTNQVDWTNVPGSLSAGFTMQLDPAVEYYYLNVEDLVVNCPLANDLYPFYLDTASLPAAFYTYWADRGVDAGAISGWQVIMWGIINGIEPMFYLKVDSMSYDLVDGLQYLASSGTLEAPLRVNGDYPLGAYNFTGTVEDEFGYTDDIVVAITFVSPLALDALDLLGSTNLFDWTNVSGSLSAGFTMQIDPVVEYYYFDAANLVVNRPLADDLYPFYLDTSSLPAEFYTYWEARGVTESASGGWEEIMWDIINGIEPMFYLKVDGTSYDMVDGLQYLVSGGFVEEPLRVNGDYPQGMYNFRGTIQDESGCTDEIMVAITFVSPLALEALDLLGSTNQVDWIDVYGDLMVGFTILLDPVVEYYYLDVENLAVNRPLANDLYPFYLDTVSLPAGFYTYWEARGVDAGAASGWQMIMWDIITGAAPMFYLKVDGVSYDLVDGLQYLASGGTLEAPLRVNGDYPLGVYNFNGTVEDGLGFIDDVSVKITFNDVPVAHDQNVSTDEDTALGITLTASDQYPGTLIWDYSQPGHGSVSGTAPDVTYHPDENWSGSDNFTLSVDDENYGNDTANITITVDPINDPPTAHGQSVNTLIESPVAITLEAEDVEDDPLFWYRGDPSHGSISGVAPNLTYTPFTGYTGPDSFLFWVEDSELESERVTVSIMVYEELEVTEVDLQQSTDQVVWGSVDGALAVGYKIDLDTAVEYYYLDVFNLIVNRSLADSLYPFYLDTTSLPTAFYTYWEARGVTESASGGWEEIMWDIITGTAPMFYLKVDGTSYDLVDGLQYLASGGTLEEPLRINGDYWPGIYTFSGVVEDELGYTDELTVEFTLNDIPVGNSQSVTTEINIDLGIVLSVVDHFGEPLQYEITQDPTYGTLSGTLPNLTYDPVLDFIGQDNFEFKVTDSHGAVSQAAVISILVHEPACLTVDPISLEQILSQDTSDTQTFTITNTCVGEVTFEIIEAGSPSSEILLYEDFENNEMPPSGGWETIHDGDTPNEWEIKDRPANIYEGQYAAWVGYHFTKKSDEWLITPLLNLSTFNYPVITFMALSDTNFPGATVQMWVLDENNDKLSSEPLWDMVRDENWINWEYHFVLVDLRAYAGYGQLRIGWEYVGQAGESFGLDMIKVGNRSEVLWASASPETQMIAGGETQDVVVSFDSTGLGLGDYFAELFIEDSPYPEISIPLTLHVRGEDRFFYLPLIVR